MILEYDDATLIVHHINDAMSDEGGFPIVMTDRSDAGKVAIVAVLRGVATYRGCQRSETAFDSALAESRRGHRARVLKKDSLLSLSRGPQSHGLAGASSCRG